MMIMMMSSQTKEEIIKIINTKHLVVQAIMLYKIHLPIQQVLNKLQLVAVIRGQGVDMCRLGDRESESVEVNENVYRY